VEINMQKKMARIRKKVDGGGDVFGLCKSSGVTAAEYYRWEAAHSRKTPSSDRLVDSNAPRGYQEAPQNMHDFYASNISQFPQISVDYD